LQIYSDRAFEDRVNFELKEHTLQKFNFDIPDFNGNSPLHIASQYEKVECMKLMIESYGMKVDIRNRDGLMPTDLCKLEDTI
jgi:ankyrin repeat protein